MSDISSHTDYLKPYSTIKGQYYEADENTHVPGWNHKCSEMVSRLMYVLGESAMIH